ncbi:Smr/MutS family protein [Pelagibacterales bacterium]|jgi:DNA-nicking Smr family endonuclease|nr:Smr/MutS family protein [Pelagibacterales bacterium]
MRTLDLHDYNLADAYQECQEFIAEAYKDNIKKIEIITGKSGPIRKEFPFWAENNHQVQYIEPSWHGGSFIIKIQKKF